MGPGGGGSEVDFYFSVVVSDRGYYYHRGEWQLPGNFLRNERVLFLTKAIAF